jgi:DNA (cytosine-5)-methyltransferase 1
MKYFSMFTGVGGFELGIGKRGECIGFSEIDKYASQLLSKRFPSIKNYGDATKINPDELPDFDMLCGGFPCQSFSIAGKRRGFQDTRGTMFFHIVRILEVKRPQTVFLENVKGLLNHDKGETFKVILQTLGELGYDVQWMVLNSKFFGVPQNRERVFIIGSLRGQPRPEILPFRQNDCQSIEEGRMEKAEVCNTITARYYKQGQSDTYIKRFSNS